VDGWVGGWMGGSKSRSKYCLQQSKITTLRIENVPLICKNKKFKIMRTCGKSRFKRYISILMMEGMLRGPFWEFFYQMQLKE
jgi:hypothetical protein